MDEAKTVSSGMVDIYARQCEDVASMRTSLLAFDRTDPLAAKKAIQNITVLRVYHQISRIIRYTEVMDKLEDKMYNSIDHTLDEMDEYDENTWVRLVQLQERLQRSMIASHELLQHYLDFETLSVVDVHQNVAPEASFGSVVADQSSREKIRDSALQVIAELTKENPDLITDHINNDK